MSYHSHSIYEDLLPILGVVVAIFGVAVVIGALVTLAVGPDNAYEQRIERKYNIEVVEYGNAGRSGGEVVYRNSEGTLCSATQAPNDVLVGEQCGEVGR